MADISKIQIQDGVYNIKDETSRNNINSLNSSVSNLNKEVRILNNTNRKFILVSDSYGTLTNANTTTWCQKFIEFSGLNSNNFIIKAQGGARFDISQSAKTFSQLLDEVSASDDITDIIVCGGYNDQGVPYSTIKASITNFKSIASTKFPNAKISIGFVGCTNNYSKLYNVAYACHHYIKACKELNLNYLNNVQFTLKENGLMSSDTIHPNDDGQIKLGYNILFAYLKGCITEYTDYSGINLTANENFSLPSQNGFFYTRHNGVTYIGNRLQASFTNSNGFNFGNGNSLVELCQIDSNLNLIGDSFNTNVIPVNYLLQDNGIFYAGAGVLIITNRSIKFRPLLCTNNNYRTLNSVTWIQIQPFKCALDTMLL